MFASKALRQASAAAAHSERTPMIKFLGPRKWDSAADHSRQAHPAAPTHELPKDFSSPPKAAASFSSYRQQAQQHGPLSTSGKVGKISGHALGPVAPAKGEYFDRNELPARFRRTPIDLAEIDAIETGGAALWS